MKKTAHTKWLQTIERNLRGEYLMMATDAEWIIIMIIHECLKGNLAGVKDFYTFRDGKKKDINDLTFEEKIAVCENVLSSKFPNIHNEHLNLFVVLNQLRDFRNTFAHCKIDTVFSKTDKTQITIHEIKKGFKIKSTPWELKIVRHNTRIFKKTLKKELEALTKVLIKTNPSALFPKKVL